MTEQTLFNQLNSKDVNEHVEKKNGLTYLAWSYAHQELKKIDSNYTVKTHEFPHPDIPLENYFVPYLATPEGYFVQVSVTVKGQTETEWLPVLDFKNKSLPKGNATTFDINKASIASLHFLLQFHTRRNDHRVVGCSIRGFISLLLIRMSTARMRSGLCKAKSYLLQ